MSTPAASPARNARLQMLMVSDATVLILSDAQHDSTVVQAGPASVLFADFISGTRLGADRVGAPRRPAERIGARVADQLLEEIGSGATIDRHASDQIIPFASLADGTSRFQVPFVTGHAETAGWLASLFLRAEVRTADRTLLVRGQGAGYLRAEIEIHAPSDRAGSAPAKSPRPWPGQRDRRDYWLPQRAAGPLSFSRMVG